MPCCTRTAASSRSRRSGTASCATRGTDIVLFDTNAPLSNVIAHAPDWVQVYSDPHNVAFAPRDRVAALHLPPQPSYTTPGDTCTALVQTPPAQLQQAPG